MQYLDDLKWQEKTFYGFFLGKSHLEDQEKLLEARKYNNNYFPMSVCLIGLTLAFQRDVQKSSRSIKSQFALELCSDSTGEIT